MAELPLEAFYDLTQLRELALSPSGDRLAFTADEFAPDEDERVAGLFVVPTDGSRDPHRLTRVPGARSPKWGPDGDRLAFCCARESDDVARRVGRGSDGGGERENGDEGSDDAEGGDETPDEQVWLFDLSLGGDARRVTDREEGVREFDWSPDGDRLVVSARDPTDEERDYLDRRREGGPIETERLQHKLDGVGWLDSVTSYLFVVDVATGEERRLDDAYGGGAYDGLSGMAPSWGAGGRIAFTSCRTDDPDDTLVRDVYAIDPDGDDLRRLTDGDLSAMALAWGPDGERLAFTADDPINWCIPTRLFVADGDGYEAVTADLDRTVARGAAPVWTDAATLAVRVGDEGRTRLVRAGADGDGVERVFEAQGEGRALTAVDVAGETATVGLSDPSEGHDAFALDAAALSDPAASLRRLTALDADLVAREEMPECRRVRYESDGREIDAVLYHPPSFDPDDPDEEPRPLVVAVHGGPISYDEPVFEFDHAALVSRGYVVLRPNYRGGSSYGRAFAETLRGRWGTVEVDDIAAGIEAAVDREWADPDRVFGFGFSYGGIAQGYLVTQTDLLTAAAPEHGIYDLRSAYGTDDSHVWMENEYGLPWEVPNEIDAASSVTDAGGIDTPLLVTAGGEDWRCPPSQSEQLYVAAKKAGVDARLVIFPDEHHAVGDPDRAVRRLTEIVDWYERHDPAERPDG